MTDSSETRLWLARPYEGDKWMVTDVHPTDELRRHVEYRQMPADLADVDVGKLIPAAELSRGNFDDR